MYSILIRTGDTTYIYAVDSETEEVFAGDESATKTMYASLLEKYPVSKLIIVHNVTVTSELTITDVE